MAYRQRWYVMQVVFEVTIRTLGGRFWLRPDAACKAIIDGVFGKALQHYDGIQLHAYDAQSNHVHYLVSATVPAQLPLFLDFVHGNIARQINALRGRRGTFWSRRGAVIAVIDPRAQVARLRYLLAQGPAAGLVCSPTQWPGAHLRVAADRRRCRGGASPGGSRSEEVLIVHDVDRADRTADRLAQASIPYAVTGVHARGLLR